MLEDTSSWRKQERKETLSPNGDLCTGERVAIFPLRVEAQIPPTDW